MPRVVRANCGDAGRVTDDELVRSCASRRIGSGVGDHASPESSSRTNTASEVGSTIGSLANDVRRFSRLFSDQVCDAPDAVTIVPKRAFDDDVRPRHRRFVVALQDDSRRPGRRL